MDAPYTLICIGVEKNYPITRFFLWTFWFASIQKQKNFNAFGSLKFNMTFKLVFTNVV
jgi:hypothetical protein